VETSIFAFPTDLHGEGVETVLDNVQLRAGLGGITLAAVYHEARDLFPHNPGGRIRFLEGGAAYFRPDARRYEGLALRPRPAALTEDFDPLTEAVSATRSRGLAVHAWTVFLHVDWTCDPRPEQCERTAFGDPLPTELCPANPDARAYAVALAGDIARHGVATIVAESLHYHPLEHGYHHERYFLPLGGRAGFLLGLCFCEHCLAATRERGGDAEALRRFAVDELERAFAGEPSPPDEPSLEEARSLAGGELAALLDARAERVASLAREVAAAAGAEGARFAFLDASGAVKGYATGRPEGDAAPSIAWRLGVDVDAVACACGSLEAIAYAADPARVRLDLEAYRSSLSQDGTLSAALRPMLPDCESAENLAEKLRVARAVGLERVDFYHYGLAPLAALDRIQEALAAA
jgi:hypothetical protein